ncbi:hypothetical protein PVAND_002505 [Polypedilum vanderplanki]|uniref:FLYWCH-type domain-containing protein n=1 Tax=Polypedilum vanderplanki TaxID=319348 RepID=A0A9J6BRV6_POLVA|nr:hypothetical protein PVAND_002505 [Polypedilum vanderplanki]
MNKRKQIGSSVKIWWRCTFCSKRKKNPCHARCITNNNEIIKISSPSHNHPPQLNSTKDKKDIKDLLQYVISQRKKPLVVVDDYLYRRNRDNYWRCIRCSSKKCRASLLLTEESYTLLITEHTHLPETEKLKNKELFPFNYALLTPPQPHLSAEYVPNRRGGFNLWYNGHIYRKKVEYSNSTNWVCLNNNCNARVVTRNTESNTIIKLDYPVGVWSKIDYEYITSENGRELLKLANGYLFRKEAKFKNHIDWVCVNNSLISERCTARAAINTEKLVKLSRAKHNHKNQ